MKRAEKTFFVDDLTKGLEGASCAVLVDYTGLTVKLQQDLKKKLKPTGAKLLVVKNTLFKLAGKEAKVSDDILTDSVLSGQTALVISEKDPIAPLQVLAKFAKENEILNLKVGIVEGNFQDKESLLKLASLPSKEVLYGQLIGSFAGPMSGLVGTLNGNLQKLVYILQEYKRNFTASQ